LEAVESDRKQVDRRGDSELQSLTPTFLHPGDVSRVDQAASLDGRLPAFRSFGRRSACHQSDTGADRKGQRPHPDQ
jgi:hypothetical protein